MKTQIDIFSIAKPQSGEFVKFINIGDSIQGTYIDKRQAIDSFNNEQTIYVLEDKDGKCWNVAFRLTTTIIHERMDGISYGQIVGFKFDEHRESKRNPGTKVKIIRIYADPKLVNREWIDAQKALGNNSFIAPKEPKVAPEQSNFDKFGEGEPFPSEPKSNEAIEAIRALAKTKGLTKDALNDIEGDEIIERFTGLPLTEENLTKVIIALTSYVSK